MILLKFGFVFSLFSLHADVFNILLNNEKIKTRLMEDLQDVADLISTYTPSMYEKNQVILQIIFQSI